MKCVFPLLQLLFMAMPASGQQKEVPLDIARFYQVVSSTKNLEAMVDGDVKTWPEPQYHLLTYPAEIRYTFPPGMDVRISSLRFYDGMGTAEGKPFKVYAIAPGSWKKQLIATFTGDAYNEWVTVQLKAPVRAQYLVIQKGILFPTEFKIYGDYTPVKEALADKPGKHPFRDFTGVNGFEWNILKDPANESTFGEIDVSKFNLLKPLSAIRHYMDWEKIEHTPGKYTFSPTRSGAWDYDRMYQALKADNIEVLACFKTIPSFIINTYPENDRDYGNVPARYGADLTRPDTYVEQARAIFQYAARYGSNPNVGPNLVKVDFAPQFGPGTRANERKIGLGLIRYIECDNERDKWWAGRKAYQTGREYAANLSAFYDGDQGRLGPGTGVKAADSAIQVVIGGIAAAEPDYIRAIIDWCQEFRGGDLCFDVINYHQYANDAGSVQYGQSTRGMAPETARLGAIADKFTDLSLRYAGGREVWVTETGYDLNQASPHHVPAVGGRSIMQTQADWILRTALLYARKGIDRLFFYQLFDDNPGQECQFCTTGLADEANRKRRPALDFLMQANQLIGDMVFTSSLSADPVVDVYTKNASKVYVLYSPTESGRKISYALSVPAETTQVKLFRLAEGKDAPEMELLAVQKGKINLVLTETPIFITF
ncbi:hypothetical protein MKQ68_09300 [Chitinophaga horti]|uniref:Uncharacterized protein n=1 Tax=Chitinophaga horti TaxID=2920382 RepID=A0ABY6JAJ0_9BACT|nr:hypothetical protein [Chitinophaga horti]UYQ95291.1 hypothetical protein MKQ68_09300 [Chitinophaga horti]